MILLKKCEFSEKKFLEKGNKNTDMNEWNRKLLELTSKQWIDAMNSTDNFSAEIRSKEAVDRHSNGDISSFNACMGSSVERVEKALACIAKRGYVSADMDALDIGSGNGVFTLPFAEQYRHVTSLDISSNMQDEIRRRAAERGLTNIDYLNADWKDLDLDAWNLKDQYDLVLCSINPRGVQNYETLNKMNLASRGGCCLMTFAGRSESNHKRNLQQIILGRTLGTTGGNDIIFPFNMVYHMGGEPDMAYTTVGWEHRQKPEDAIEGICYSYWRFADITDAIKSKISEYVYANLEDGAYVDRAENLIGIMVWDAWKTKNNGLV
jgi:predicted O-methyltransferase YrrM